MRKYVLLISVFIGWLSFVNGQNSCNQGSILIDEDFSTSSSWTEYDPDAKITINQKIEFNDWKRYDEGFVHQSIPTITDFALDYDFSITADGGNAKSIGPCFADYTGSLSDSLIENGIYLVYYAGQGSKIFIYTVVNGNVLSNYTTGGNSIPISLGQPYYASFAKCDTILTLGLYSDQARTIHISGSPVSINVDFQNAAFTDFYAVNSWVNDPVGNWEWTSGWVDNIVLKSDVDPVPPIPSSPNWNYTLTGSNHSIAIQNTIPITIDSVQISSGDYIGVFYDSLGSLACGGYICWGDTTTSLTAWGEDVGNDGFVTGEDFSWKLWRASDGLEIIAQAQYQTNMPNEGSFAVNGMSALASLEAVTYEIQNIVLPQGWCFFSTYIDPFEDNLDSIFAGIIAEVLIIKDENGLALWPQFGLNMIGDIINGEGYQVKMNSVQTLEVVGLSLVPEITPIEMPQGWSYFGYVRKYPAALESMLSTIDSEIIIVKDAMGNAYWPMFSLNMIGNLVPGNGYQAKMNSVQILYYPANSINFSKVELEYTKMGFYQSGHNTGSNMTLGIPFSSWETLPNFGDEVGIFTQSGLLVGSGEFKGDHMSINIWGNDEFTQLTDGLLEGQPFNLRIWDNESKTESVLKIESWLEGDNTYETNKIAVAGKLATYSLQLTTYQLFQNSPNPFSQQTEFSFYLPEACEVKFDIFNLIGEKVASVASDYFEAGKHSLTFNTGSLPAGTYFYRLNTTYFSHTRKMTILR